MVKLIMESTSFYMPYLGMLVICLFCHIRKYKRPLIIFYFKLHIVYKTLMELLSRFFLSLFFPNYFMYIFKHITELKEFYHIHPHIHQDPTINISLYFIYYIYIHILSIHPLFHLISELLQIKCQILLQFSINSIHIIRVHLKFFFF